ncbi:MAG: hypothetical protein IJU79_05915 [Desulfovibrionaceae bacterium]|nr:hypothetical protein [Desulfovibrionaceae bacterium]
MTKIELLKENYNQEVTYDQLYSNFDSGYDAWFRSEVVKGFQDIKDCKVISQEEAERMLYKI